MAMRIMQIHIEDANNESRKDLFDISITTSDDGRIEHVNRTEVEVAMIIFKATTKLIDSLK